MSGSAAEILLAVQLDQAGIYHVREFVFAPPRKWRADFMVDLNLLVEIEGGIGSTSRHLTYTGFTNDCEKYAAAAILGYRVIRCTPAQVEKGTALAWIEQALA